MLLNIVFTVVLLILVVLLVRSSKKLKRVSLNLGNTNAALSNAINATKDAQESALTAQNLLRECKRRNKNNDGKLNVSHAIIELETQLKAKTFKGHQVSGVKTAVAILKKLK